MATDTSDVPHLYLTPNDPFLASGSDWLIVVQVLTSKPITKTREAGQTTREERAREQKGEDLQLLSCWK